MIRSVSLEKFPWLTVAPGRSSSLDRLTWATRNDNCEGCAAPCCADRGISYRKVNRRVLRVASRAKGKVAVLNQGQFSNLYRRRFAIHSMTVAAAATQLDVNFGRNCCTKGLTIGRNGLREGQIRWLVGRGAFGEGLSEWLPGREP
jgi:hypothetical protein